MTANAPLIDSDLQLLPPLLRVVALGAGIAAALRLVERRGGRRIYVPEEARLDHDLVPVVTLAGWQALCAAYPAEHVMVPMAAAALRTVRNRQMHAARATRSLNQLAGDYRMTRRRVEQIMSEACGQPAAVQDDLFG